MNVIQRPLHSDLFKEYAQIGLSSTRLQTLLGIKSPLNFIQQDIELFNSIIKLALEMPSTVDTHQFTPIQAASIVANLFLGQFGDLNMNSFFSLDPTMIEKRKCILNYFKQVQSQDNTRIISFHLHKLDKFPDWKMLNRKFTESFVFTDGKIEDTINCLQIDFANMYLGGGVLRRGCVQEEILFLIYPELFVSMIAFNRAMKNNEAVLFSGIHRFSRYSGYSKSFKFNGTFENKIPTNLVAIDAFQFERNIKSFNGKYFTSQMKMIQSIHEQLKPDILIRELNKAYIGFSRCQDKINCSLNISGMSLHTDSEPIATGNWGCGAFGGNVQVKALIQLIAASSLNRSLIYFTFGDLGFLSDNCSDKNMDSSALQFQNICNILQSKVSISELWNLIDQYRLYLELKISHLDQNDNFIDLFEFILREVK